MNIRENVPINYSMPIVWESIKQGKVNEAFIKGVAIKATTSRNKINYLVEELDNSHQGLVGKNIYVGHGAHGNKDDPSDNVGIIESINFDGNNVNYIAKIFNTSKHPDAVEMVRKKLWQNVSIDAMVDKLEKTSENFIARGINFTGLAFVRIPGVADTSAGIFGESFTKAIAESYNLQEEKIMAEKVTVEETVEKPAEEVAEPVVSEEGIVAKVLEALKKENQIKEELESRKKLEEKVKELEKKLEEKATSEAVVSEGASETTETEKNLIVEGLGTTECSFYFEPTGRGE